MPPIEPPTTQAHRWMPSASASAASTRTWSPTVTSGKRDPQRPPSGPKDHGPVVPWQPPSTLAQTTKNRSVSRGAPGPASPSHHPAVGWPGPAAPPPPPAVGWPGPAAPTTWLSPVRACSTSTAFEASGASVPHVSYATRTDGRRPPRSGRRGAGRSRKTRSPTGPPSTHPPMSGALRCAEAGLEVGQDVLDALQADGEADEAGRDAGRQLLLGGELGVRGRGRVDHQAPHVTDVGHVAVQLEGLDEALARLAATVQLEGEYPPAPLGAYFCCASCQREEVSPG